MHEFIINVLENQSLFVTTLSLYALLEVFEDVDPEVRTLLLFTYLVVKNLHY